MDERNSKIYSTVAEVAEIMGVSSEYVRELLNRAKFDSEIKLRGKKIGKEWIIDSKSINDHLGIESKINHEKENYIKELEDKIKKYEKNFYLIKSIINSINQVIDT